VREEADRGALAEAVADVLRAVGLLAPAVEEETLAFVAQSLRSSGSELGWEMLEQLRDDVVRFQDCQSLEAPERMARFPRVHMLNSDGATPLEAAVRSGDTSTAAALLRYGALADEPFYDGKATPLFYACERGDAKMAAALMSAGCDPSVGGGPMAALPLYIASYRGHAEAVAALLDGRASPNMCAPCSL
jgi:ankyrin repeat protein